MVLDLGCHAGGWSQIVLERVNGREGLVVGVAAGYEKPEEHQGFMMAMVP